MKTIGLPGHKTTPLRSSRAEALMVAALALLATYAFFCEYLPPFARVHLWSDIEGYHFPLHRFAFQSLKEGHLPLWDPSIYCGIPFAGNIQAAALYPPTWLMYAAVWRLPAFPFQALQVFTFLHVWGAFLMCYLWLRGRSAWLPSALGASVYASTGFLTYELLHPGVAGAMTWMPLAFRGVDDFERGGGWRPLWKVALASALSFLAGYPAAWIVNCIAVVVYALASSKRWRAAAAVCIALAASCVLSAAQILPMLEGASRMVLEPRYLPGKYRAGALLLAHFLPNWFDFNPGHATEFEPGCLYLYLGLPAIFGVAWMIRRRAVRPYRQPLLVLAVALVFANPPHWLVRAVEEVPFLDNPMQPYYFQAAVAAMAALISAISLNDFLCKEHTGVSVAGVILTTAPLVAWSIHELQTELHGGTFATGAAVLLPTCVAFALFCLCLWALRGSAGWRRATLATVLLISTLVHHKVYGSGRWFNAVTGDVDRTYASYGIAGVDDEAYREVVANRHFRVVTDESAGPDPTQYRMWGLATPAGFDPLLPLQYRNRIEQWVPFQTNRLFYTDLGNDEMLRSLGVRYVFVRNGAAHDGQLQASSRFRLIGRKDVFCHVYEYRDARPAYYWTEEDSGKAEPVTWLPERREFVVRAERQGRFVLAEQFWPGWRAVLDGRPAQVGPWREAFLSVRVPEGQHRLRFEFRPASLLIGAAMSCMAFAAMLVVAFAGRPYEVRSVAAAAR